MGFLDRILYPNGYTPPTPEQIEAERIDREEHCRLKNERWARERQAFLDSMPRYELNTGGFGRAHSLRGRCANGNEADRGIRIHVVPETDISKALCGADEGRRSAGWSRELPDAPTCPRCLKKLKS